LGSAHRLRYERSCSYAHTATCCSGALRDAAPQISELGGIRRQYLNHWHEASAECDWVRETFQAPLYCPAADAQQVAERCHVDHTFFDRHMLDDDVEVIPTPGHTSGTTCFLWESGQHRCLFTGDTINFPRGNWIAHVLDSSDRDQYLASLELIRGLDFDAIIPSVSAAGQPLYDLVDHETAQARIDTIIRTVQDSA
jgi:glyoxylase-like metal-dependent hydrolase (beta-lactamase superfamily II)